MFDRQKYSCGARDRYRIDEPRKCACVCVGGGVYLDATEIVHGIVFDGITTTSRRRTFGNKRDGANCRG